ncbi:hypothetical protein H2200_012473 [Cladophialophora chaetospira]|uniref:SMODS and SLOG-associating 2TM effector domain-containing protein n=1 Tax=Cladophialophora chaetospira TaxID=386627 RepID=A0AA38WXW5_9EURO|nr:hypothetical protein H2200_012473 [Cladophialophora chaetospira]
MSQTSESPLVDAPKGVATSSHVQVDPSRSSDASSNPPSNTSKKPMTPDERQKAFRQRVGIPEKGTAPLNASRALSQQKQIFILVLRGVAHFLSLLPLVPLPKPTDSEPDHQFRTRIEKAYQTQRRYYWFITTVSHSMLWLQIGIGATLTALGQTNNNTARVAITVLGAVNTVIAGFLTFLKSRNQPNRALQFRNGLRGVVEDLWQVDSETGRDDFDVDKKVEYLWAKYKEVVQESEANYPDLWVSLSKMIKPSDPDKNPNTQMKQIAEDGQGGPKLVTRA